MPVRFTTVSFTVEDVPSSSSFFTGHLGYREQIAADGFSSLTHDDAAVDIVLLRRGIEVLPEQYRQDTAAGVILALVVDDLDEELARLQAKGVAITMPLREEEWGERLFQVQDPNGIVIELVQWNPGAGPAAWDA